MCAIEVETINRKQGIDMVIVNERTPWDCVLNFERKVMDVHLADSRSHVFIIGTSFQEYETQWKATKEFLYDVWSGHPLKSLSVNADHHKYIALLDDLEYYTVPTNEDGMQKNAFVRKFRLPKEYWAGCVVRNQKDMLRVVDLLSSGTVLDKICLYILPDYDDINLGLLTPFLRNGLKFFVLSGCKCVKDAPRLSEQGVRSIQQQCRIMRLPFYFINWGRWIPENQAQLPGVPVKNGYADLLLVNKHTHIDCHTIDGQVIRQTPWEE